eukprot:scaffold848_cov120-Amphora_coffeaeformis.AAC.6
MIVCIDEAQQPLEDSIARRAVVMWSTLNRRNNTSFFDAPFVWTSLVILGGTSGMKGRLASFKRIPFEGPESAIGTGATLEGIDKNPAYYEFVFGQNFRHSPETTRLSALNFFNVTTKLRLDRDDFLKTGGFYVQLLNDISKTGGFYVQLLNDSDTLVATDSAFLLRPWLESARRLGRSKSESFYKWNARTQLPTWNPSPKNNARKDPLTMPPSIGVH